MGFDVERFLEPIDDELKCSICLKLLEDPLATPCGHVFCAQCIVQWVAESGTCPLTCEQLSVDDLKRILPLTSLIAKLNVRCANFRRGCPVILRVENQHVHLSKCQHKRGSDSKGQIMDQPSTTSNSPETREFSQVVVCQKGCGLPLLYQEPNSHDCIKALQTQVASLQMKLTKMEQENDVVCERTVTREESLQNRILNLEKELHAYEIHALNFERKLREYRSQIGYLQKQLNIRSDQAVEESQVEVVLERTDGSLGFNIMGGSEVGSNSMGGGIVVSRVAEGGPASKSEGLKMNDEIIKVNDVDLSEATHEMAVRTIKNAESPIHIIVRRKIDPPIEYEVNSVVSTGTQTDMPTHDMDTDSGIHERFSPRQDELCLSRLKSLDDGTSSSESSHRRFNFSKDDLELVRMRNGLDKYEPKCCGNNNLSPHATLLVQDVNYMRNGTDENSNFVYGGQSYVTAVSDQVYFDEELDYEYEEITLWFGNCDLGLTFCCGEEDESAVYVCEIEPGSVAYLDGRIVMWDQVLKINDVPVGSIEDIEPLVYDSNETIKFLVARPAQEVQATLIGSEGNNWEHVDAVPVNTSDYNDYSIGVIHEEEEDAATVNSEKTAGDKCEKDSGVGRTDDSTKTESSEQDAGEETAIPQVDEYRKRIDALEQQINELNNGAADTQQETKNKENVSRSSKSKSSDSSSNSKNSHNGNTKKSQNNSSRGERKNYSPPRKEKDRSDRKKNHRDSSREHSEYREDRESREKQKYSDNHRRSRKLAHVDRNIRASYMRAVTTESMQQIAVFGSQDHSPTKSSSRKKDKKSSRDNLNDQQQAGNNGHQNMEWKVKITRDGSQIFIRKRPSANHRQARNKLLRERAQQLSEERKGLTTEDDTVSVYQGRYWPRDMRRRQLQRVREARRKKSEKLTQRLSDSPHTNSGSESGKGRKDSIVELSHRRMRKTRDHHFDDFVTVQEILTQRNPGGLSCGPIHVTTV